MNRGKGKAKKILLILSLTAICIALAASGTLAALSWEKQADNVITMGNISLEIIELDENGKPADQDAAIDAMPGISTKRSLQVKNIGDGGFYLRIQLDKEMISGIDGKELSTDDVFFDIDTANWTESNGYYYYNTAVSANETTAPLFTTVTFGKNMDNSFTEAKLKITVTAQAVQSKNNASNPLEETGW